MTLQQNIVEEVQAQKWVDMSLCSQHQSCLWVGVHMLTQTGFPLTIFVNMRSERDIFQVNASHTWLSYSGVHIQVQAKHSAFLPVKGKSVLHNLDTFWATRFWRKFWVLKFSVLVSSGLKNKKEHLLLAGI